MCNSAGLFVVLLLKRHPRGSEEVKGELSPGGATVGRHIGLSIWFPAQLLKVPADRLVEVQPLCKKGIGLIETQDWWAKRELGLVDRVCRLIPPIPRKEPVQPLRLRFSWPLLTCKLNRARYFSVRESGGVE